MPQTISIGPLMLATDRLLALFLVTAFLSFAGWLGRSEGSTLNRAGMLAAATGIVGARAGFVVEHWSSFQSEPWTMLAFWQGGFSPLAGSATAVMAILFVARRQFRGAALLALTVAGLTSTYILIEPWTKSPPRPLPPTISLVTVDGRPVQTGMFRGRPLVINLWATWCPPCRREMPMLIKEANASPVRILLVNQGEDALAVQRFLDEQRLASGPVLLDLVGNLSQASGSEALPTTLFVDRAGVIRTIHAGEISRAALREKLSRL